MINTFAESDSPEVRVEKFNALTGLNLRLGEKWTAVGSVNSGERCLMDGDEYYTGPMNDETLMHWTAMVALGYRLRAEQE